MDAFQRLLRKFIDEPDRITPEDFKRLLADHLGYREWKNSGSERTFHKKGANPLNVPTPHKGKYVKSSYVKRMVELLNLEDYVEDK